MEGVEKCLLTSPICGRLHRVPAVYHVVCQHARAEEGATAVLRGLTCEKIMVPEVLTHAGEVAQWWGNGFHKAACLRFHLKSSLTPPILSSHSKWRLT